MSNLNRLIKLFQIPDRPSGMATWSNVDLIGSRHTMDFSWSKDEGVLDVVGQVDGQPSFRATFAVVARSVRLRSHEGFPPEIKGAREISSYLGDLIMMGNAPELKSTSRPSP